jgi:chemotaxis protein methyltransferase CheR
MAFGDTQELKMSDAEFRMFSELIKSRCGLHFDEGSRFLVEKRLARRVEECEAGSFAAYHYLLRNGRSGEEEFSKVVDALTTNETYFFRESGQLRALIDEIIPDLLMARRNVVDAAPINVWSAGCSSGEEPYSVAAMALEAGFDVGRELRIYASDISKSMLAKSRRGVYREASFRETGSLMRDKYFVHKDGQNKICEDLKKHVDFIQLNLLDRDKVALLGTMDVILCRNVIIYFDLDTKKEVMDTFFRKLKPGGYLLLGHSESLINVTSAFELKHLKTDLVYRRPVPGEERSDPWHHAARAAVSEFGHEEESR